MTHRMSGLDAGFLYLETPTLHLHTGKIAIVDPSSVPGGYTFDKVKEVMASRLHLLPSFRRRIVPVPLGISHPVFVDDPGFDLDYHVRRIGAPPPGGERELGAAISDIMSHQLDRSRPLWELWVVEGLDHGHIGFVAKIHHALADGMAAAAMLTAVLDTDPDAEPGEPEPWEPERIPSAPELVVEAVPAMGRELLNVPRLVGRTVSGVRNVIDRRSGRKDDEHAPPLPFGGPKLSFNTALTPHRWYAFTSLSLDEVKAVKKATDTTVNDVVLAVTAGALRRWLHERGDPVDRPLVASVPVSTRSEVKPGAPGNEVSNLFAGVPVHLEDPLARLRAAHDVMRGAKEMHEALGADMLSGWLEAAPGTAFNALARLYSRFRLAERHRPPINLVISNVPGPTTPLHIAGARLLAIYSMGPILEGIGLNVTVWSYLDRMNFGLVGCREQVPDLWSLADGMEDALAELRKATIDA